MRRSHETVSSWAREFAGRATVAICENGRGESEGVAAWLRGGDPASAKVLAGGHAPCAGLFAFGPALFVYEGRAIR